MDMGVSQSVMKKMMRCRQELLYHLQGWRSIRPKVALNFGDAEHHVLEDLYLNIRNKRFKGVPTEKKLRPILKAAGKRAMKKAQQSSNPSVLEEQEMILAWLEALLHPYCQFWEKDFDHKLWLELESSFNVEWHGWMLKGRRDAIRLVKKGLWVLETKTKGRISEATLSDALSFDFQNEYYVTGTDAELAARGDKRRIKGVLYNIIRRPGLKLGAKESLKEYAKRVRADVDKRQDHYFKRFEISYPEEEKERFRIELLMKLKELELILKGELPIYRRETSCEGKWNCDFLPCCASGTMVGFQKQKYKEERR